MNGILELSVAFLESLYHFDYRHFVRFALQIWDDMGPPEFRHRMIIISKTIPRSQQILLTHSSLK